MINFRAVSLDDKGLVYSYITESASHMCDFTFGNLYGWSVAENTRICEQDGFLYIRSRFNGISAYAFPWGKGDLASAVKTIESDAVETGRKFCFFGLSKEEVSFLQEMYADKILVREERDYFDYVYLAENLATLKGRKYHSKKNHVNSFCKKNSFVYEEINRDNISECREFSHRWHENGPRNPRLDEEKIVIDKVFSDYFNLGFKGALIRVNGEIVAYAIGEEMVGGKTFCTHFEKASPLYPDAYAAINKLFAENALADYLYINREDDAGSEGLRKAKLSYHPEKLVEKYYAQIILS